MKAYFYKVIKHKDADDCLDTCLENLQNNFFVDEGHYEECDGRGYRIERFKRNPDYCTGDFVKQQKDDIPPQAADGKPLKPSNIPLGHLTAFLYLYKSNVLIIQGNRSGISAASMFRLIQSKLSHSGFDCTPLLSQATVDDLLDGTTRNITVKFAAPENLSAVESDGSDLQNLDRMRRMFGAPSMEISCGFDTPKEGGLNNTKIAGFIKNLYNSPLQTRKIQVKQEGAELLDLLGKKHTYTESIVLNASNMDNYYITRKTFLERAYKESQDYIENFFKKIKAA